ncbi:386_t:CDS:2 [Paraglomus brasilianum]|uniref:386_t:CDS:1 n=1 Tax=Paraglomus brasilianum TaxID=144538 RepID=A0A9N9FPN5_9GLOM|nr:386_t:CDS:2 [Paraglomus brasilianum]
MFLTGSYLLPAPEFKGITFWIKKDIIKLEEIEEIINNETADSVKTQDDEVVKNILLIGSSGSGKSTLANVLVNKNDVFEEVFKESDRTISATKNFRVGRTEIDGKTYRIIDTVGFGDTMLEVTKIPPVFKEMDRYTKCGIDYVLFVVRGRLSNKDLNAFKYLREIFFDENIVSRISVVRTNFPNFEEEEDCDNDINSLLNESNEAITEMIELCNKRVVHVDNPQINIKGKRGERENNNNKKTRKISRKILLNHLQSYQNEESCKPKSGDLNERIREELKKEVFNYVKTLIERVESCELSAEVGKNISQAGKDWMENSNDSILIFLKGIYGKPIGLVIRLVGDTTEVGSEIIKLITQKIYEEKIVSKVKEEKEKRLLLLKKDLVNRIKDCDFRFREQLDEEQTSGVFENLKDILKPFSEKLKE